MKLRSEGGLVLLIVSVFLILVYMPLPEVGATSYLMNAVWESLHLVKGTLPKIKSIG